MNESKAAISELRRNGNGRTLTDEELDRLKKVLLRCYTDVAEVCKKYDIQVMLGGGSCLGAIRHKGFIPWDDDFDINMPRKDYERFKKIFDKELGDKYILDAPNYSKSTSNRFPKVLVKGTRLIELGMTENEEFGMIKIDIFTAESIPNNPIIRMIKGYYCNLIMAIAGSVQYIEWYKRDKNNPLFKTTEMIKFGSKRRILGGLFSFKNSQFWFDKVDKIVQYNKESSYVGFPTGRNHYFGEIHNKDDIFPLSKAIFEGKEVYVAHDVDKYLKKLYGSDYMILPPEEKREAHMIMDIKF